jgi:hypothetical protein
MRANLQTNLLLPLPKQPGHESFTDMEAWPSPY